MSQDFFENTETITNQDYTTMGSLETSKEFEARTSACLERKISENHEPEDNLTPPYAFEISKLDGTEYVFE